VEISPESLVLYACGALPHAPDELLPPYRMGEKAIDFEIEIQKRPFCGRRLLALLTLLAIMPATPDPESTSASFALQSISEVRSDEKEKETVDRSK